jgi:hypothetical protein
VYDGGEEEPTLIHVEIMEKTLAFCSTKRNVLFEAFELAKLLRREKMFFLLFAMKIY